MTCPLCEEQSQLFLANYFLCPRCDLRFLRPKLRLSPEEEAERYRLHCNDSSDLGYQKFVSPLIEIAKKRFPANSSALDFGCGADSAASLLLSQAGFRVSSYDPQFFPDTKVLADRYDLIIATEVVEHLHSPGRVLEHLRDLLKPRGAFGIMTQLFNETIDFSNWYYQRDPTHVCFYSERTFQWLKTKLNFKSLQIIDSRYIWLES